MLKETKRNTGAKGIGTSVVPKENRTQPTLADLGLDKKTSMLARRHLSQEQKYALYIEVEPLYAKEAKQRMHLAKGRGVKGEGHVPQASDESTTDATPKGKKRPKQKPQARDQAATAVGISGKSGGRPGSRGAAAVSRGDDGTSRHQPTHQERG